MDYSYKYPYNEYYIILLLDETILLFKTHWERNLKHLVLDLIEWLKRTKQMFSFLSKRNFQRTFKCIYLISLKLFLNNNFQYWLFLGCLFFMLRSMNIFIAKQWCIVCFGYFNINAALLITTFINVHMYL